MFEQLIKKEKKIKNRLISIHQIDTDNSFGLGIVHPRTIYE